MVDALRRARRLVAHTGCLIELHPTSTPALVLIGDAIAGEVDTGGAKARHQAASDAVTAAVGQRLLVLGDTVEFDFSVYADTIDELQQHIHDDWREGHIGDVTFANALKMLRATGARPRVRERVVISRLRPHWDVVTLVSFAHEFD
jgi:hypothetical protein